TSSAAKQVRSIIRDTNKWCADPRNDRRESWTNYCRKALREKTPDAAVGAAINLRFFANWHGQHGVRAILDGQKEGWAELDRAIHYLWLHARIMKHGMQASVAASVLATTVTFDEHDMAEALATRLVQSVDDHKMFSVWDESAFAAFMLK